MPVDPQIRTLLDMGTGVPATNTLSVAEARAQYEARIALMGPEDGVLMGVESFGRQETANLPHRVINPHVEYALP